ncbi:histone-lysine N-methyltransferase SETMAR-like [Stegodyphus dumicola]|uniref:histone-lysine N-methyltransferase SETMAR-like n=1 Tax=Stegodyphus dumicola TaxID=202533 RepID=UPI0015AC2C5D|nr:histone-lysine N-methyltransferase SETMAR-like [Stegodyphus dumicola]
MEQRIKFCFKLGKTATETHDMLVKVYGQEAVSKKCVYECFKRFTDGKEDVKDRHQVPVLDRPPYSLDLAPADFFLFPRLKGVLKGQHFSDITEIQQRVTTVLRPTPTEAFADSFQQLYTRCQKCIVANGEYFEGQ